MLMQDDGRGTALQRTKDAGECQWCGQPARYRYTLVNVSPMGRVGPSILPSLTVRACNKKCARDYWF